MAAPRTPSAAPPPIHLHSRVKVSNLGHGEVLFVGQTSFAAGVWVGIALDHPNGKNNGSVQGKRYFECDDGYGVFVRSSQVHVLSPEEEMHSVDDEPVPAPAPAPRAARPSAAATPSSAAAARLSPRKNPAVTPARPAASRSSLAPGATPASAVRRTSAVSTASASSSASSSRPPTAAGAAARLGSPVKSTTGVRSPVKPAGIDPRSGRSSVSSTSVRSTTTSALASRTGSPSTPAAAAARTVRPSIGASSAATPAAKTAAGLTRTTVTARTPAASTSSAAAKPQTPSAARAGLRPVPASRPSMLSAGARTATSSPSVTSAARIAAARSATASAPISRTASAAGTASRTGSALGPSRLGPRSSAGSAVSSGRTSASQRLLDEEDAVLYNDDLEDGDANLLVSDPLLGGEDMHASHDDDIGADEADQTISAATAPDTTLKSTKLLNKSTRDFMSLVEPSASSSALRSSAEFGALQKELEELRAKVRVLEKKRDDERSQIAELEKTREEAERSIAAVPKLTAKVQDLQAELKDQRKLEKDWSMQKDDFERQLARLNDELESLTLDREMAEEKAETAALEAQEHLLSLETANAKIAAMEKDLNPHLLRRRTESGEPGAEGAEDDAEEEAEYSAAAELVQRENDQLRRVLRDLRDRSNEIEGEQRRKIIELERENAELIELNSTNDSLLPELENAESMIEDLKLQLDDALGAQDLVEQLTERNLQLSDVVKKLRDEIVEHETIAEINNELEEQHTINEKELREEVDLCESRIRDLAARNEALENNAVDYQNTFGQFRELVSNLQAELEAAKAEQAEYGGAEGSGRKQMADQAMLNLNLKLQSSALKSQAKTIDLELGRLQAAQASSHLEMVRTYLPAAYFEADDDAVNCLLFFRRMAVKSDLIKTIVETNHDIHESLSGIVPEAMVGVCQMRHSIAHFSALSQQIAAVLRLAPPEVFLRGGRMYRENMAIERKVDAFIGALRREELKEHECGLEFGRFVKQFEDFTMALGGDENDSDLAAKEVGSANLIDHDLDTLIAALGYAKQQLAQLYADDDDVEWELAGRNIEDDLFDPLQELITRIRNTKVLTRKVLRRLLSLADNDEAVRMEAIMHLPPLGRVTSQLVTFATLLCKTVAAYVGEVRTAKVAFDMTRVLDMVGAATEEGLGKRDVNLWSGPLESTSQLASTMQTVLGAIVEQENVMRISGPGPWLSRAEEIKTLAAQNPELELQVGKLGEDARDLLRQVKARDQALQEGAIKIERLQKQLERARAQVDEQSDVRTTLGEVQRQASAYQEANDALQTEIEALQKDHDALKLQMAAATEAAGATPVDGERERGAGVPARVEGAEAAAYTSLETSYLVGQLEALKGALRHLRRENAVLKGHNLLQQMHALARLPKPLPKPAAAAVEVKVGEPVQRTPPRTVAPKASARAEASQVYSSALSALALSTVVDLTPLTRRVEGEEKRTRAWVPHDKQPRVQLEQHALTRARLVKQLAAASHRLSPHAVAT
ncbi:microtubule-associated protein dynactin DCTN1/Glued [Moesziomyces antarcticus T-34]|uniref:Microtubule-associated protein dynactin DCTN1/Glued n=1 Tax=Pseudozyma antarctica (strain T-34) TaxID=1151754 RepID=M9MF96_PSEA3|nr:microtubule-associated protein dynactin DCTN1/Glued [Moesziomyces antarcticus T-34]